MTKLWWNSLPIPSILFILGIISLSSACGSETPVDSRIPLSGKLLPFTLCFSDIPPATQVRIAKEMGYTGLAVGGINTNELDTYAALPEVQNGSFKIAAALWWRNYDTALDNAELDPVLERCAVLGTALWAVADWQGGLDRSIAMETTATRYAEIAARCQAKGVEFILYPHVGCVFETVEEALSLRQMIAAKGQHNVKVSIHLCHELKRGNGQRMAELVALAIPYLALASVSGAEADTFERPDNGDYWDSAIMPLDQGSYDIRPYIQALADNNFAGPIILHTYNLPVPASTLYNQHLERSLAYWKHMVR